MTDTKIKPRFSRKSLNMIMIVTAILILVLSQMGPEEQTNPAVPATGSFDSDGQVTSPEFSISVLRDRFESLKQVPLAVSSEASFAVAHWRNEDGARVYFVPAPEIPMLDVQLVFDAGAARDADLPGLAHLTNDLLLRGTQTDSADALARQFESLGVQYSVNAYRDMALMRIRVLNQPGYLNPAIDLVARILGQPAFSKADVAQLVDQYRVGLERSKQEPGAMVDRALYENLYPEHAYGSNPGGTEDSLARIAPKDLRRFHEVHYVTNNLVIAMVGAISREQAEQLSTRLTARLATGERAATLPKPDLLVGQTKHIAFDSNQTHVRVATLAIDRQHPDYYPLYVGSHILGGSGFSSLLNKKIRQEKGLAYSVFSRFQPMQTLGPFYASLQTETQSAALAVDIVRETIESFVEAGPTAEQLEAAKQQITSAFPLRAANNARILGYLSAIGFYDLPLDYLNQFNPSVESVTLDQIKAAFKRHIDPDNLLILTLGRAFELSD